MTTIGIGIVGLGGISQAHRVGYNRVPDLAQIVAVCDRDAALAASVAEEIGARAYTDLQDLLTDPAVAAVDLTLPHDVHYAAASAALASGRHVLIEKPLAVDTVQCASLIALAAEQGLTLGVAENTRFVAAYQRVKQAIDDGLIGEPRLARTFIYGSEVRRLSDPTLWKGRSKGSGGGTIIDSGPHSFYLLRWLLGEFETVQALSHKLVAASEVEDHAIVAGRLSSGALYSTEYTFTAEIPWGERLEVYGSKGSLIVDQMQDPPVRYFRGAQDHAPEPLEGVAYDPLGWKTTSIADGVIDFVRALSDSRAPLVAGEDGLFGVLVAERAYASIAAGGCELPIDAAGVPDGPG